MLRFRCITEKSKNSNSCENENLYLPNDLQENVGRNQIDVFSLGVIFYELLNESVKNLDLNFIDKIGVVNFMEKDFKLDS